MYLHYDPYTRRERATPGPLASQRMDFLLLLPNRQRVVIEVDGRQHYADNDGRASTTRYAGMVREDRSLRLASYDVYRFGGKELENEQAGVSSCASSPSCSSGSMALRCKPIRKTASTILMRESNVNHARGGLAGRPSSRRLGLPPISAAPPGAPVNRSLRLWP